MYEDIREKAIAELEEKKKKKREIQTVGMTFATAAIILFIISTRFGEPASFWIKFPILILALVYGIVYATAYGIPFLGGSDELSDEEIEREMVNIYRKSNLNKLQNEVISEELELREIEELKERYNDGQDFV